MKIVEESQHFERAKHKKKTIGKKISNKSTSKNQQVQSVFEEPAKWH
jgi:hypothetical protein